MTTSGLTRLNENDLPYHSLWPEAFLSKPPPQSFVRNSFCIYPYSCSLAGHDQGSPIQPTRSTCTIVLQFAQAPRSARLPHPLGHPTATTSMRIDPSTTNRLYSQHRPLLGFGSHRAHIYHAQAGCRLVHSVQPARQRPFPAHPAVFFLCFCVFSNFTMLS